MNRGSRTTFVVLHIIVPLILGGLLYLFFNRDAVAFKAIGGLLSGTDIMMAGEYGAAGILIRCYAADFLWAYALTISVGLILDDSPLYLIFGISTAFGVIMELLQMSSAVYGTFDVFDIATEVLASTLAIMILKKERYKERSYEKIT